MEFNGIQSDSVVFMVQRCRFLFVGFCLLPLLLKGYVEEHRTPIKYRLLLVMAVGFLVIGTFVFGESMTQTVWDDIKYGANKPGKHLSVCE